MSAAAIHGDNSQSQRERALQAFTRSKVQCLVATDVAARGIHVDAVACVVHFDPPADEKDYIHRSRSHRPRRRRRHRGVDPRHPSRSSRRCTCSALGFWPIVDRADITTLNDTPRDFVAAPEPQRDERPERPARPARPPRTDRPTARTDRPSKPFNRNGKPRSENRWGAERPAGTGHPRKSTPAATGGKAVAAKKPHRKGNSGAPGRVGGVRRSGEGNSRRRDG